MRLFWQSVRMISSATPRERVSKQPLVTIVGATGTGKSQLAVELARRFNGEIINGDAMQLYAGLPIITNKITVEEQQGIAHHLLGCIDLHESTWVVSTFVERALKVIEDIRSRGKLPILVGGTHYYTQSLLFRGALAENDEDTPAVRIDQSPEEQWPILAQSTDILLAELKKVDPAMSGRWHPNDRRKIQRSLMIYLQTGRPASEIYAEQELVRSGAHKQTGDTDAREATLLRFSTLIFWVHTDTEALRSRLDSRVHTMLKDGLLGEVEELTQYAANELARRRPVDETRGIWVSIGFKEFKPYYETLATRIDERALSKAMSEAIEKTKIANRQYAKRQVRWIRIKLVNAVARAGSSDDLYLLDSSDQSRFDELVVQPATALTDKFLKGEERPAPGTLSPAAREHLSLGSTGQTAVRNVEHCEICDITCSTDLQWVAHIQSKKHGKLVAMQRKEDKLHNISAGLDGGSSNSA